MRGRLGCDGGSRGFDERERGDPGPVHAILPPRRESEADRLLSPTEYDGLQATRRTSTETRNNVAGRPRRLAVNARGRGFTNGRARIMCRRVTQAARVRPAGSGVVVGLGGWPHVDAGTSEWKEGIQM